MCWLCEVLDTSTQVMVSERLMFNKLNMSLSEMPSHNRHDPYYMQLSHHLQHLYDL